MIVCGAYVKLPGGITAPGTNAAACAGVAQPANAQPDGAVPANHVSDNPAWRGPLTGVWFDGWATGKPTLFTVSVNSGVGYHRAHRV